MTRREIFFEEAQTADAAALIAFMNQVAVESEFLDLDDQGFQLSLEETRAILAASHEADDQLCLLAKMDDQIIGLINVRSQNPYRISHIGGIFMALRKAYWGYGIGRILLEEAITWAQEMGRLKRLELTVQVRNERAVRLYKACGFDIEGIKKRGARTDEGEWLDLYYMGRLIE